MRLTNTIRETIFRNLLAVSPLMDRAKEVVARRAKLAEDIRQELLYISGTEDTAIEAFIKDVKGLDSFKNNFCSANVSISTGDINFSIKGEYRSMAQNGTIRVYNRDFGGRVSTNNGIVFGPEVVDAPKKNYAPLDSMPLTGIRVDKFHDRLCSSDVESEDIFNELTGYKLQVMAALKAVVTDAALIKAWPEVEPFIPKPVKLPKTDVALSFSSLNAICGIPKPEK